MSLVPNIPFIRNDKVYYRIVRECIFCYGLKDNCESDIFCENLEQDESIQRLPAL